MAGLAALWTLIAGGFLIFTILKIFRPSEKLNFLNTRKKAVLWSFAAPVIWIIGIGILLTLDTTAPPSPQVANTEKAKSTEAVAKSAESNVKNPLYSASSDIDGIVYDEGHLKISLNLGGSGMSLKDLYAVASICMTNVAKLIKEGGGKYDNIAYVDFILNTDFTNSTSGVFAKFSIMRNDILSQNFDDFVFAQIYNLVDKHQFFTKEAKTEFRKYCLEKSDFPIKICK